MEQENLEKIRLYLQGLVNKYLEPEQRFSLEEMDEDILFLLIDLFLEKDDLEREHIRAQVEDKLIESQQGLKKDYDTIMEIKNKFILKKLERQEEQRLKELDNLEKDFDKKLEEI